MRLSRTVLKLGILTAGVIALTVTFGKAYADSQEPIDLIPVAVTVSEPVPDPRPVVVKEHDLDPDDVEILARLLWSSPLRYEGYKKGLVWTVMNRAAYGEPFGSSIKECVNKHEFTFYDSHAHRSEENLRIVRQAMNEWLSAKDGYNPGTVIPRFAYYIQFYGENNRRVRLMDINRDIIDWDPIK